MTGESTDGVLQPDELDPDEEYVTALGENRYLVRTEETAGVELEYGAKDGTRAVDPLEPSDSSGPDAGGDSPPARTPADVLAAVPEPHGVDVTLKTDGRVARHRVTSNDVREVFVDMLTWYASQLDDDLTPEEALRVLVATSDLEL